MKFLPFNSAPPPLVPQMAPMNWLMLYLSFSIMVLALSAKISLLNV